MAGLTNEGPLRGRVALVTGANHGIGAATATELARLGADVCVTYLRTRDETQSVEYNSARGADASQVLNEIRRYGGRGLGVEADLADPEIPRTLFDQVEDTLGPVSVLVHNASAWQVDSFGPGPTPMVNQASIDPQFLVDARAGALLMAEFIDRHRARRADWGRIVTLTSGEGRAFPGEVSYGAAKAALISYSLSAAAEMAADGVTVNVVYPPVTDTGWVTDEVRDFVARDHEHHHVADPSEVVDVIAWLCSQAGRIVTGNIIRLR